MELLLKALDEAHWELGEAFRDLPDADVWRRPDPRLLSIGEIAAHIGFGEAQSFIGEGFQSPLTAFACRYYTANVVEPVALELGASEVYAELGRIHEASKEAFFAAPREEDEINPYRGEWTWGYTLRYMAFHVAYHTGQIYSVRHLLGHSPPDN
jgi:hypothetical protein